MTRATKQIPAPVTVEPDAEKSLPVSGSAGSSTVASTAMRLAQAAALGLARGTGTVARSGGALGAQLLGQGFTAARSALARAKDVPTLVDEPVVVTSVEEPSRRGRRLRRIVIFGGLTAAVAAGVAVWRLRRPEPAPVAERPPSLNDVDAIDAAR